jgi:hypothetical protein
MNTGFDAYNTFFAIKLHFTSERYDYFKFKGKTNITKESFMLNKDRHSYYRLSRKYNMSDLRDLYVANFAYTDNVWVNRLFAPEFETVYKNWMKVNQSLTYTFTGDMDTIFQSVDSSDDLMSVDYGGYPKLLSHVLDKNISMESFIILNDIMNFFPVFDKKIQDTVMWPTFKSKCEKYKAFIDYDKVKLKSILKDKVKEYEQTQNH